MAIHPLLTLHLEARVFSLNSDKDKMITEREAVKTIHQGFQIAKKLGFKPVDCVITDEKGNVINKEVFHV